MAGGCDGWCVKIPALNNTEMYDPETDQWIKVADLPVPLSSAKMELLEGRPTIIGGYNSDQKVFNNILYQYFVETNEWKPHPFVKMRIPRSSAAVFQVPRDLFNC